MFGPPPDRDDAVQLLRQAVEAGVDHIDTAEYYGPHVVNELIRQALHPYPTELVLVSNVGARRDDRGGIFAYDEPDQLRRGIEENLRTLDVDSLPVVNLRLMRASRPDSLFDDQLAVMTAARDNGLIGAVGLSNVTLPHLLHAATNFFSTRQFFQDAEEGELPTYSFIEPQIIGWNHNDMHPPFGDVLAALGRQLGAEDAASLHFDPPSSLIGGEYLLARVYDAIRASSSATGSNYLNTTLLVTFDEHGGTYDHVPPPPAVPPDGTGAAGQMGFTFNRSGVRIPTLAVSAWIPERTVVNDEFRATSLLATMRQRFNLGQPLSARAASARSFADIFTLPSPRAQEDWPQVTPRPAPVMHESLAPLDAPLGLLGKSLLLAVLASPRASARPSRHQARRHDHRRTRDRHRSRGPRRHLPRNAGLRL